MMSNPWIFAAIALTLASGIPGLWIRKGRAGSQTIATILHLLGCAAGLVSVVLTFMGGGGEMQFAWPAGGTMTLHVDALSAFFLLPLFLVMGAGSLYGEGYWPETANPMNGRRLRFFYGTLTAGFAFVTIAGDAWSFLIGWEIVGLSAFFLVGTESDNKSARSAAWIYLIAAHTATLVLFAMFGAFHSATGTWRFQAISSHSAMITPILLLSIVGFGIKAGLMPFHVWLPEAHAAAPSHVSAILSGLVLKMGVYGLIRIMTLVPLEQWFGLTLLFAGIGSGVLGVVFALAQHDLKRLLAYHSIENIGIIFIGLGAGVLGRNEAWGALATAGAMLHVWNHAFFKSLLFFAAGSVVHATGTRMVDELGGLLRKLRATGFAFLVGAVAICGLPPLNGFVSEWLIYLSGFRSIIVGSVNGGAVIFVAPALALIGALAVACFVKAFSVVFLGNPRSEAAQHAHKEPISMRVAMALLAAVCVVIGAWPLAVYGPLSQATRAIAGNQLGDVEVFSVFSQLPIATFLMWIAIAAAVVAITLKTRHSLKGPTWGCGYAAPSVRMQYTASSFAAPLVNLFRWALHPEVHREDSTTLFRTEASFETHVPDPVLERFLVPAISRVQHMMSFLRQLQAGRIQVYILYMVAALLILLAWSAS